MGRDLDGRDAHAGIHHLAEQSLQVRRLGRGPLQVEVLITDPSADRAHHPGNPAGCIDDGGEHVGDGRLAIRPGDADHLQLSGRVAVDFGRQHPEGGPGVGDNQ